MHVSNIPYDMRWAALKDLFRTEGKISLEKEMFDRLGNLLVGEVMYTEVFERDGKSLGCG